MEWFRVHHGISTDPKLHRVSREAKVSRGVILGAWVALLEQASSSEDRGSVSHVSAHDLAYLIDAKPSTAKRIFDAIRAAGMIDESDRIRAWDRRQPISDDAAKRKSRQRERPETDIERNGSDIERNETGVAKPNDTRARSSNQLKNNETHDDCHGTVTPRTEQRRTEQNTITNVIATCDDFHESDVGVPDNLATSAEPSGQQNPPPSKAVDPWSQVFDAGKSLLARYDIPPDRAHGMISRWRKSIPDPNKLMAIFLSAGKAERADIAAWIGGSVKTRSAGPRGGEISEWKRYMQACGY